MNIIRRIICLLVYLFLFIKVEGEIPFFRQVQVDKENKNLHINIVFQDIKGYIWIGTDHGLYKYDGFLFEHLVNDSNDIQTVVTSLSETIDGNLLMGTQNGNVWVRKENKFYNLGFKSESPIKKIIDAGNNGIWVCTYGSGVQYLKNRVWEKVSGLSDEFVYTMLLFSDSKLFIGTDLGLNIIDIKKPFAPIKTINSKMGLPDNIVRSIEQFSKDEILLGFQEKGICYYNLLTDSFSIPEKTKSWISGPVSSMVRLNNEFWIGTEGDGIIDYEFKGDKRVRYFTRKNGFDYKRVHSMLKDREGNIWISVDNKLLITSGESIEKISNADKIPFDSIQAITSDADGYIWFANKRGLFRYDFLEKSNIKKYIIDKRKIPHIVSLFEDDWGYLWIGTFDNGLYRMNTLNGEIRRFGLREGLLNANVISITGKDNRIWLATLGGIIVCDIIENIDAPGSLTYTFSRPTNIEDPGENFVYDVFIDSKERVWFGTDGKGITVYDRGKFRNFTNFDNDRGKIVYSITEDSYGNIWFSTLNHGVYRFDGNKFINIGIKEGLRELDITGISLDNNKNIVVVHSRGIDLINTRTFEIDYLGSESGIESLDCDLNTLTKDIKGNIWIGTQNGLIRYYNYHTDISVNPLVDIKKIYTFMKPGNSLLDSVFNYNQNQISFEFIGLLFSNPESVIYRYRLFGFSNQWIITHDRIVTFPNLPPGNYTFELEASKNNRFVNPSISSFSFKIRKPIYKQPLFIWLMILIGATTLILFIRDREIRLKRIEKLKKEKMEYQYETLKSQINPHFLFNSFNTLISIIDVDKDSAIEYVEKLSDYFRSMVQYRDKDTISLKEEMNMVNTYFYLQTRRFGKNLELQIDIPAQWLIQYQLPPLSLQLLIENAVKHNAVSFETPLYINVIASDNSTLLVSNNLNPKKQPDPSTGIGIENIINRFKMLSDKEVLITKNDNIFTVEVPLIPKK